MGLLVDWDVRKPVNLDIANSMQSGRAPPSLLEQPTRSHTIRGYGQNRQKSDIFSYFPEFIVEWAF